VLSATSTVDDAARRAADVPFDRPRPQYVPASQPRQEALTHSVFVAVPDTRPLALCRTDRQICRPLTPRLVRPSTTPIAGSSARLNGDLRLVLRALLGGVVWQSDGGTGHEFRGQQARLIRVMSRAWLTRAATAPWPVDRRSAAHARRHDDWPNAGSVTSKVRQFSLGRSRRVSTGFVGLRAFRAGTR
jgi:hypothetical protein